MSTHCQQNSNNHTSTVVNGNVITTQQLLTQCIAQVDQSLRLLAASAISKLLLDQYRQSTTWSQASKRLQAVLDSMSAVYDLYIPTDNGIRLTADGLRLLCTAPLAIAFHCDASTIEALRPFSSLRCQDDAPLTRDQIIVSQLLSPDTTLVHDKLSANRQQLSACLQANGFSPLSKEDAADRMAVLLMQKECVLHEKTGMPIAGARHIMCHLLQNQAAALDSNEQQ